jgi:uncharacterized protein
VTAAFERRRSLVHDRRAAGRVRECHGDLHCGNVVRWSGRLTPFDGIEFDPALRFIDVVNDIAFLTMDLAERGRPDLRHAALQAWCESTGDFAGLPLLQYYECYRALVRAKVAALGALQAPEPSVARDAAIATCRRYLDWAAGRLAPRRPALLLTCGLSGSGKTWLARAARATAGALHVRSDVERKRLAGLAPQADSRSEPDGGIYTLAFNARTYGRLERCAAAALAGGEASSSMRRSCAAARGCAFSTLRRRRMRPPSSCTATRRMRSSGNGSPLGTRPAATRRRPVSTCSRGSPRTGRTSTSANSPT